MEIGILLVRLAIGLTLAAHGAQKLFGWFGGPGLSGAGQGMEKMGFIPGRRNALAAGLTEAGAGLLLALGLATPAAAAGIVGVMTVAASVHFANGFFAQKGGYEYPLILGLAALAVAFTGPGSLSLDALLGVRDGGAAWGLAAATAGALGGGIQLASRRRPAARSHP